MITRIDVTDARWESVRDELSFTFEALRVLPNDPEIASLAARFGDALADQARIAFDGLALHRAALGAAARVQLTDAALDHAIASFASDVLPRAHDDRSDALYLRFFPEPHENVIDLGLDAELPIAALIVQVLDADESLDAALRAHREPIRALLQQGSAALVDRAEALASLGRHCARVEAWIDGGLANLRIARRSLAQLGRARKMPARWSTAFFLTLTASSQS